MKARMLFVFCMRLGRLRGLRPKVPFPSVHETHETFERAAFAVSAGSRAGHFDDCRSNSKIIDHPNVAAAGHPEDGELVSVWRGDRIDSRSPTFVPKGCRMTLQINV
jgi:hypothetical protein